MPYAQFSFGHEVASFILYVHPLAGAVLVGKVVLLSFVVDHFLMKNLERELFGKVVRQLFQKEGTNAGPRLV